MLADSAVIGSSPLMLLVALAERARGREVVVLDREPEVGGVWRSVSLGDGLDVEYACHLVEQFPDVYEHLAVASGVEFAVLNPQPVRVLPSGRRVAYASRRILLAATLWSSVRLVKHRVLSAIGRHDGVDWDRDAVFRQKVSDFVRHHWRFVVRGTSLQAPVDGYAAFIAALTRRCDEQGVEFRTFDVVAAEDLGQRWLLTSADGGTIRATHVHSTCSATLTRSGSDSFTGSPVVHVPTHSLLVRLPESEASERVSYAAFWDDPEVVRVSRIDLPGPPPRSGQLFLVQLTVGAGADPTCWASIARRALEASGAMLPGSDAEVIDVIGSKRVRHSEQMPAGRIAPRFHTHASAGNLASGVARWLQEEGLR